jgi:alpha-beta hydrolase superfamily lysophospholipase
LQHTEGSFEGARGTRIYYQSWMLPPKAKAILVLAHGQGDHSGRYAHVADYLTKRGFVLWASDHRGHGKSGGKRGHTDSFDDYLADLDQMIRIAKDHSPGIKTFLMGASLGGLVVLDYAERHGTDLAGIVVTSPLLGLKMKVPGWKMFLGKTLSGIYPTFSLKTGLDANLLAHDREIVQRYVNDPLVHGIASTRFYTELRRAQDETMRSADKLKLPCLVIQGGADGIVDPDVATEFYKRIASSDKTLKVYDRFYHEVLNEIGKESVLADIDNWLSARI